MNRAVEFAQIDSNFEVLTISELIELYEGVAEELRYCAEIIPGANQNRREIDLREDSLLGLEENLLSQAAIAKIHSERDALDMIKIWTKASGIEAGQEPTPSDRIVMNVFRFITDNRLVKD